MQAYHNSEIYRMKDEMEKREKEYLAFKGKQESAWWGKQEEEEKENRPLFEKLWAGVYHGSGNAVGDTVEGIKELAELFSPASIQKIFKDHVGPF
jgi:predicted ribonuclease toxin of YeeF-YezG toxin-antitoxin module